MSLNAVALYETLKSLRGLFSSPAGAADISMTQQMSSSLLPSRNDEAIQLALDAVLSKEADGITHLERIRRVRAALLPHQQADWRLNLGSLKMTERFEQVKISETITGIDPHEPTDQLDQSGQLDPALQQRRRGGKQGQPKIDRKFDRRARDYEWTMEDPRIQHLILVSKLVEKGDTERDADGRLQGVAIATAYLLAAGLIKEKSTTQQVTEKLSGAWETSADGVYRFVAALQLDDVTLGRIMTLPEGEARDRELSMALRAKRDAVKQNLETVKQSGLPAWVWILLVTGIAICLSLYLSTPT